MADFEVPIVKISKVESHPGADRLSLMWFRGFAVVSAKLDDGSHRYKAGDLVAYCPQDSIVPEYLLRQGYWLADENPEIPVTIPEEGQPDTRPGKGMLGGTQGNRVKPMRLRGVLSEGIMFPVSTKIFLDVLTPEFSIYLADKEFGCYSTSEEMEAALETLEGLNVMDFLGITKYEPVIPERMSGDMCYIGTHLIPKFDIENIKKYPKVIEPEDEVIITEKLHGTFFGMGFVPGLNRDDIWDGEYFCYSKGLGKQGLAFKNSVVNENNLYVKMFNSLLPKFKTLTDDKPLFIMGEIFGKGVQDLAYGTQEPQFRMFEIHSDGKYSSWVDFAHAALIAGYPIVPSLYLGPMSGYTESMKVGNSTLGQNVREGVVIKTTVPKFDKILGRVILKDINEKYLLRKNATEYN